MKLSIGKFNYISGILFGILTYLVIPIEYERLCLIPIILICVINIFYSFLCHVKINRRVLISGIMLTYTILLLMLSQYRQDYVFRAWITILMIILMEQNGIERVSTRQESIIWFLALSLLVYRAIVSPRMYDGTGSPIFQTAFYDRIETELCIILFMYYAVKNRHISGVIYAVLYYFLLSTSRGTLLLLTMFFGVRYGKTFIKNFLKKRIESLRKRKRLLALALSLFFIFIIFSYYWVYQVADSGVASHGFGINDTSNFSRFASTIYSIKELLLKHNLLISGFGSELRNVMGIPIGQNVRYMGQWLVQSHNSILNLLLCFGIIPGILYLDVLFMIIKKVFNFDNLEYTLGYIVYSFIIVLIAKKGLDVFWLYILLIPEVKGTRLELSELKIRKIKTRKKANLDFGKEHKYEN
ncbi:hypothetical protein NXH76_23275 [Blautia schinkii]|nr:hypothetical protein [Blautia schinkii]